MNYLSNLYLLPRFLIVSISSHRNVLLCGILTLGLLITLESNAQVGGAGGVKNEKNCHSPETMEMTAHFMACNQGGICILVRKVTLETLVRRKS